MTRKHNKWHFQYFLSRLAGEEWVFHIEYADYMHKLLRKSIFMNNKQIMDIAHSVCEINAIEIHFSCQYCACTKPFLITHKIPARVKG